MRALTFIQGLWIWDLSLRGDERLFYYSLCGSPGQSMLKSSPIGKFTLHEIQYGLAFLEHSFSTSRRVWCGGETLEGKGSEVFLLCGIWVTKSDISNILNMQFMNIM